MAKITMDTSEYEVMKENKTLLEKSLETERSLREENKKLQDEKIKALEDAKMKVVKISKQEINENVYSLKDSFILLEELKKLVYYSQHSNTFDFISTAINKLFTRQTSTSFPKETVTTHGLDEVKLEIRDEYFAKQSKEDREAIEKGKQALVDLGKSSERILTLNQALDNSQEFSKKLSEQLEEKDKQIEDYENKVYTLTSIKDILKDGYKFWNKGKILKSIITALNK